MFNGKISTVEEGNYTIREYKSSDKNEVYRLYNLFGQYFAEIDNLKRCIVGERYADFFFNQLIKDTTENPGKIFVVEKNVDSKSDGEVQLIGFAAGNVTKITPENSQESVPAIRGRILELFVEEAYRGIGIGKKLMVMLEEFFKEYSCDIVNVEVFAPNEKAYGFYKSLGFSDRNHDLIKIL